MKNLIRLTFSTLFCGLMLSGCYYDKENELYPYTDCGDTVNITYSQSIAPIMVANCNVCHSKAVASGGVVTDNYADLSVVAKNGALWTGVNWEGPAQTHMPQGSTDKLPQCDLTKIKKWIDAESPNN
jgi:hypothetical protein